MQSNFRARLAFVKKLADIPFEEDGYPPPTPPLKKKSDIFNASDFVNIDKRAKDASEDISKTWEGLHGYLFDGLTSDLHKVRALFIWLGTRDLAHFDGPSPAGSPNALLKELVEGLCSGLPAFFAHLCRSANLPCVVVRGLHKFRTYLSDYEWNAVYADGSWRFVLTQDAFYKLYGPGAWTLIEDSGNPERQRYVDPCIVFKQIPPDECKFLVDPEFNIVNHFPTKGGDWQLLAEPWSMQKFQETPEFYDSYFRSSWHLASKHTLCEHAAGGKCGITFDKIPEKTRGMKYRLFFNERKSKGRLPEDLQLTNYVILNKTFDTQSLMIRLPVTGVYMILMLDDNMNELCRLRLECSDNIKRQKPFPDIPELGFGLSQDALDSGLDALRMDGVVVAREGEKIRFKFYASCPLEVQARLVHRFLQDQQLESRVTQEEEDSTVTVTVKVPYHAQNPELSLQVNAKPKDSDKEFANVLNYLLTPDRELVYLDKGQAEKVQDELLAATKDDDVHRLESAIREFRAARDVSDNSPVLNQAYVRLRDLHLIGRYHCR